MSVHGRSARRLLIVSLAVPVIITAYLVVFARRLLALPRVLLVGLLGAPVIGAVYAQEAYSRAPAGVRTGIHSLASTRVTPLRAATALGLALALLVSSAPAAPAEAAKPAEQLIKAARAYLGKPYVFGTEGPNHFDCSGLIFRAFSDIGELPRIGGGRAKAATYLRWFSARGLTSKTDGARGDLVVWGDGKHIGIYLGEGKVISALLDRGVSVHGLHSITYKFTTFLKVSWKIGDGNGRSRPAPSPPEPDGAQGEPDEAGGGEEQGGRPPRSDGERGLAGQGATINGLATGTMNLRLGHDPNERIIGWVSRGSRFTITGTGESPSGALWYSVEMRNGKSGWVYSRWVQRLDE